MIEDAFGPFLKDDPWKENLNHMEGRLNLTCIEIPTLKAAPNSCQTLAADANLDTVCQAAPSWSHRANQRDNRLRIGAQLSLNLQRSTSDSGSSQRLLPRPDSFCCPRRAHLRLQHARHEEQVA